MHQLPTYSRGLVPRPCAPATFMVIRSKPKEPTLRQQLKAAHWAVTMCVDFAPYRDKNHVIELWQSGPECLYSKARYRPLVVARALVMHYQRFILGKRLSECKRVFNVHHSSVIHMTEFMTGQLDTRFPNDVQDSWNLFLKLIEK